MNNWGIYKTTADAAAPQFTVGFLAGCTVLSIPLLIWLVRGPVAKGWRGEQAPVPDEPVGGIALPP